tara:strand:- start:2713 stop:2895 length:183 start_codon:yes stop_codon:yes gene_type:complete
MIGFFIKLTAFFIFLLVISLFMGCTTTEDVGCMPVYIGTAYDEEGMMETLEVEEVGCPRE